MAASDISNTVRLISAANYSLRAVALRRFGVQSNPRLITINLTDRCNCRCKMCGIHARPPGDEMITEDIRRLLRSPLLRGLDVVRLTGGEPFLRDDLTEICRLTSGDARAHVTYLTTNGTLPDRVQEFVDGMPYPGLHVQVSIDALDGTHDKFRGLPGALDLALKSIEILREARKKNPFHLGINQTVFHDTVGQISAVNRFAVKNGIGHSIILGARHHEGKALGGATRCGPLPFLPEHEMEREEIEEFFALRLEAKRRLYAAGIAQGRQSAMLRDISEEYLNEGIRNRLLRGKNTPAPVCMAMFSHARISATGEVVPCTVFADASAGNIRADDFAVIWKSAGASASRRNVMNCPGCWIECDINPSAFYSGDIIRWMISEKFSLRRT